VLFIRGSCGDEELSDWGTFSLLRVVFRDPGVRSLVCDPISKRAPDEGDFHLVLTTVASEKTVKCSSAKFTKIPFRIELFRPRKKG